MLLRFVVEFCAMVSFLYLTVALVSLSVTQMVCYRLTAHFLVQVGHGELRKQWTWEPRMGESLFLALIDPNDVII